jgi:23S rRNA A1618 N6-methylase RlmF
VVIAPSLAVRGIDVGTGASAIYPLLGTSVYGWAFLATDIDR